MITLIKSKPDAREKGESLLGYEKPSKIQGFFAPLHDKIAGDCKGFADIAFKLVFITRWTKEASAEQRIGERLARQPLSFHSD
jgi:hypothetical protein